MEREKVIEFLNQQLEELKKENVEELMRSRRIVELEKIASELDFSAINNFINEKYLDLSGEEIREDLCYEMAFYISLSEWRDSDFFENYEEFQHMLYKKNEDLATWIADIMQEQDLYECTIEELLDELEDQEDNE